MFLLFYSNDQVGWSKNDAIKKLHQVFVTISTLTIALACVDELVSAICWGSFEWHLRLGHLPHLIVFGQLSLVLNNALRPLQTAALILKCDNKCFSLGCSLAPLPFYTWIQLSDGEYLGPVRGEAYKILQQCKGFPHAPQRIYQKVLICWEKFACWNVLWLVGVFGGGAANHPESTVQSRMLKMSEGKYFSPVYQKCMDLQHLPALRVSRNQPKTLMQHLLVCRRQVT